MTEECEMMTIEGNDHLLTTHEVHCSDKQGVTTLFEDGANRFCCPVNQQSDHDALERNASLLSIHLSSSPVYITSYLQKNLYNVKVGVETPF